jgi:hypothetical protein
MAYFEVLPGHFPGGINVNHKHLYQDSQCLGQDFDPGPAMHQATQS